MFAIDAIPVMINRYSSAFVIRLWSMIFVHLDAERDDREILAEQIVLSHTPYV